MVPCCYRALKSACMFSVHGECSLSENGTWRLHTAGDVKDEGRSASSSWATPERVKVSARPGQQAARASDRRVRYIMISEFLRRAGGIFSSLSHSAGYASCESCEWARWAGWLWLRVRHTGVCPPHRRHPIPSPTPYPHLASILWYASVSGSAAAGARPLAILSREPLSACEWERERKRDAARDACLGLTPTILHAHSHGALSFLFVLFAPLRPPPPPPTKRQCQFWSSCKIAQPVF